METINSGNYKLGKCSNCGHQVSLLAPGCPACGTPPPAAVPAKKGNPWMGGAILLGLGFFAICGIRACAGCGTETAAPAAVVSVPAAAGGETAKQAEAAADNATVVDNTGGFGWCNGTRCTWEESQKFDRCICFGGMADLAVQQRENQVPRTEALKREISFWSTWEKILIWPPLMPRR
jgi:hypothetical protein